MFGFLKKKVEEFASKITKKAEERLEAQPAPEVGAQEPAPPRAESPKMVVTAKPAKIAETIKVVEPVKVSEPIATVEESAPARVIEVKPAPPAIVAPKKIVAPKPAASEVPARPAESIPILPESVPIAVPAPVEKPFPVKKPGLLDKLFKPAPKQPVILVAPKPVEPKADKLGIVSKVKRAVVGDISLSEKEIEDFLWEFELSLLEADVAQPVAEEIIARLKRGLAGTKFTKSQQIQPEIERIVRESIREIIDIPGFDLVERVRVGKKPFVIMFLGPNGAGKTTTLAKVAHMLKAKGISCVFSASDTFRAASMEQLQHHADALGVRVVKQPYGADPAAVAFDAVQSAKANNIDCVLIDTAGRQETNKNLMEELKKIKRVASPDLLIYLDEALAGNVLVERVNQFKEAIGVDGVILSKMDMDVKGGGTISIARVTGVPIIYYGIGQAYSDLKPFDANDLLDRIFGD